MTSHLKFIQHKPSGQVAWITGIGLVTVWLLIRLVYLDQILFPLTYVLPLMVCIWTRRYTLLWTMAFVFAAMAFLEFFLVMPSSALPADSVLLALTPTVINIFAGAAMVHVIIHLLDHLEGAMTELSKTNKKITDQSDEILKHRNHLDDLVKERTLELEERNRQLEDEISERRRTQKEKERLESQLLQVRKMEALGRFAGGIAHDLNNILFPVILNAEILLEETAPDTPSHPVLKQILQAAYRQRDLIRQILTFSRRKDKHLEPIRVTPLIQQTIALLRSSLPSTIEIRQHFDAEEDEIQGDSTQVQQVVMNLCKNAADALDSRTGVISVRLVDTTINPSGIHSEVQSGEYLQLSIRDTGCGMTSEVKDHIFEPFYTTKEVDKGIGMGLAVVHGIVKDHGGAITVESEPGKGSLFTVYFPLIKNSRSPRKEILPPSIDLENSFKTNQIHGK